MIKDLFSLCFFSSLMLGVLRVSSASGKNGSVTGSITIDIAGDLVLQPPKGGMVKIYNFSELSATKEELSVVKTVLNEAQADLSSALIQLSAALFLSNGTDSKLNATQSDLSTTKAQLNSSEADLSSALIQLSSAMSRVEALESFSDILTSSLTLSETPLSGLKSSYVYIGGSLAITNNQNLKVVSLPFLTAISGSITITDNPLLSEVSLPHLSSLGGSGSTFYILIEYNAPRISVSLLNFNLTSISYSIFAVDMICTALAPKSCSAFLPHPSIGVIGGDLGNGTLLYSLFDPQWSTSAIPAINMSQKVSLGVAFCSKSNTVYIAGGSNSESLASASKLSLDTKQWSDIASMGGPRSYSAGLCLDDGETFMVCGGFYDGTFFSSCELFNPSNATWAYTQNMTIARNTLAMVLYNGKPVALGGLKSPGSRVNSTEKYNLATNSWSTFPSFNVARNAFGAAVVFGKIYIAGGAADGEYLSSVEYYDNGNSWTTLSSQLPAGTRYYCAVVSFQNKLVVLGGSQTQVDVYDPSSDTWSTFPVLSGKYNYIAAFIL